MHFKIFFKDDLYVDAENEDEALRIATEYVKKDEVKLLVLPQMNKIEIITSPSK